MTDPIKFKEGDAVRHIKTCIVGGVVEVMENGQLNILAHDSFGLALPQVWDPKDAELLDVEEYNLTKELVEAKRLKTELNKKVEDAKARYGKAEEAMQKYLERRAIQGTKRYMDMRVTISGMDCHASITEENKEIAFKEIEAIGRGEIIKRTIHPSTLESFVNELLDDGKPVPQHIGYFLSPKLSFAKDVKRVKQS